MLKGFTIQLIAPIFWCLLVLLPNGDVQCYCQGEPNPLDQPTIMQPVPEKKGGQLTPFSF